MENRPDMILLHDKNLDNEEETSADREVEVEEVGK